MTEKLRILRNVFDSEDAYAVNFGRSQSRQDFVMWRMPYGILPPEINDPTQGL
jgi:hypothetical protein